MADFYLGIDPGKSGGLAFLPKLGIEKAFAFPFPNTERDCADIIEEYKSITIYAAVEAVHSMPGQGVASSFSFGKNYGFLRGLLIAYKIPFVNPSPSTWQTALNCMTKGNKNITKAKAQELFPYLHITHATADALLIAEWLRRQK